jgi:probable HAF family extracellular repeat protein
MNLIRTCSLVATTIFIGSVWTLSGHAVSYVITDLGTLGGSHSAGVGLSSNGLVTGWANLPGDDDQHAFLYDGLMHDLGTLGGTLSDGADVNASGLVTGTSYTQNNETFHAFLYDGAMHDLGTLGGTISAGRAINASGHVTGYSSIDSNNNEFHAFVYDGTTMHDLGTLGDAHSYGFDISDNGLVTGWSNAMDGSEAHAFLSDGTMHDLGTLGGTNSEGKAVNNAGQVAGVSSLDPDDDLTFHAFLYDGVMHDLGTLGGTNSYAYGINANGDVVGWSHQVGDPANTHAFLYRSGSGMIDLNTLIDPLAGWELQAALAINDAGLITGYGLIGGDVHAFLVTPVPEPSGNFILAIGAAAMWPKIRHRG